jgi:hypothetical protein
MANLTAESVVNTGSGLQNFAKGVQFDPNNLFAFVGDFFKALSNTYVIGHPLPQVLMWVCICLIIFLLYLLLEILGVFEGGTI